MITTQLQIVVAACFSGGGGGGMGCSIGVVN